MSIRKASFLFALTSTLAVAQDLSVKWEELTAGDFTKAIEKSRGTCVLPFGVLEKHGPHLPLGNDLINVRYLAIHGAQQEFALVFPEYYFGQIFEAKHEPGTIAYSPRLQLELLQETTDEMSRNGCKKILILNGHGGNNHLLPFWANSWITDTPLIEAITTDATVASRCQDAQRSGAYVYVHRCAHGASPASIVSKAKVRDVQKVDRTSYLVLFTDQAEVGLEPPRHAEQGDRSYIALPVD
jgi:creatinine amidohydrolase/Fe(II)-dependent formamide hydrolase-like protein